MPLVTTLTPKRVGNHRRKQVKSFSYLTHVDGLRGLAIALVVIFHIFVGKVSSGVDVFLFIGGLLFLSSQMRTASDPNGVTFTQSFIRMIRRLAPSLITVITITTIAAMVIYPPADWWRLFRDASSSVLYIINWTFGLSGESYIAAGQEASLFQHMWSMSVQLQIYTIIMAIIFFSAKIMKARKFKENKLWQQSLYITIACITIVSFIYASYMVHNNQTLNYYSTYTRFWEIGVGALIGALILQNMLFVRWMRYVFGVIGLLMIICTGLLLNGAEQFPGYLTLIPLIGAFFVICAGQVEKNEERTWRSLGIIKLLETKPFKFLGKISYSLYLWHWPLLILTLHVTEHSHATLLEGTLIIIASILLAWLTHKFIEVPLRQKEKPKQDFAFSVRYMRTSWRKSETICKPIVAMLMTFMCAILIASPALFNINTKVQAMVAEKASEQYGGFFKAYPGARSLMPNVETPNDVPIQPNPDNDVTEMMPNTWYDDCYTGFDNDELVFKDKNGNDCYYGDKSARETLYVIGGSHSEQYIPALDDIGKRKNIRIVPVIKMGCPMVNEGKWDGSEFSDCDRWAVKANQWIIDNPPTMGVFITSTRPKTISGLGSDIVPESYQQVFKRYSDAGIKIFAVRDNPWIMNVDDTGKATNIQKDARLCISNGGDAHSCGIPQDQIMSDPNPALEAYKEVKNIKHIDFTPIFCHNGYCPAIIGNVMVYRDSHHLTNIFVESMIPFIENELLT